MKLLLQKRGDSMLQAGEHAANLTAALLAQKEKEARRALAALPGIRQQRELDAEAAAAAAALRPGRERSSLVTGLGYLPLQRTLLTMLKPNLPAAGLKKAEVMALLLSEECGSMEELRTGVGMLRQRAAELKEEKQQRKHARAAAGPQPRKAPAKRPASGEDTADEEGSPGRALKRRRPTVKASGTEPELGAPGLAGDAAAPGGAAAPRARRQCARRTPAGGESDDSTDDVEQAGDGSSDYDPTEEV